MQLYHVNLAYTYLYFLILHDLYLPVNYQGMEEGYFTMYADVHMDHYMGYWGWNEVEDEMED